MSARKSNKSAQAQAQSETEVVEAPVVEVVEQVEVVEVPVVETVEPTTEEPVVEEQNQTDIEKENKIVDLESEIVKLSERLSDLKKELRSLTKPAKTDGPTKMEVCIDLYKSNVGLARKDLVKLFMDLAGLTLAGARTYAQLILSKAKVGKL